MAGKRACDRRLDAAAAEVEELARRLLPEPAPEPDDPLALLPYLTNEELWRLEAALDGASDEWSHSALAAWSDAQRRAVARMLTREPGAAAAAGLGALRGMPLREALKAIAEPRQRAPRYFARDRARFRVRSS
jgi:hypothetical protein